ncbi:MAG: serine/threonine-protein kinase, partial [Gemmataceae bacterium]
MAWRLYVFDGADQRKAFPLPRKGRVRIGREGHADIALHDIYVNRVHCEVESDGEQVVVRSAPESPTGFLINGVKQTEHTLMPTDVLRLGNSHLRLEPFTPTPGEDEDEPVEATVAEPRKLPQLPLEQLDQLRGETISHYKVGEVLGRGHYGVVFQARHVTSGAEVALKVLSPVFPQNPAEMKVFAAALKSLLLVKHPNLVTLYNAGKTGPYCWLALEYVEGDSLAQLLREPDAR